MGNKVGKFIVQIGKCKYVKLLVKAIVGAVGDNTDSGDFGLNLGEHQQKKKKYRQFY